MPFAAFDLHKKIVQAVIDDDDGRVLLRDRFPATGEAILAFANEHLSKNHHIALEATTNSWPVAALLEPFAGSVTVSNPMATRAIAQSKIKTDKVDALVLAQLLRVGYLPKGWTPDAQTRQFRLCRLSSKMRKSCRRGNWSKAREGKSTAAAVQPGRKDEAVETASDRAAADLKDLRRSGRSADGLLPLAPRFCVPLAEAGRGNSS